MTKYVPNVGEAGLGDNPYAVREMKFKVGFATASPDVTIPADTDTVLVEVVVMPTGSIVHSLSWLVEEAFAASSTITIGDTVDVDGWAKATDVGATVVDSNIVNGFTVFYDSDLITEAGLPAYTAGGRLYGSGESTGMAINLVTVIDSTVWSGILDVFVVYSMVGTGAAQATS